jgi:trimethylamine--corrinoid protein Co-methyltransferase
MPQCNVALPQFMMLSREQCETVHSASLEILRRTGVRVFHQEALALLRETDAVISDGNLVRLPPGLVEWALDQAPSRVALCRRGSGDVVASLEGKRVHFGTGSDCPNYLDPRTGARRRFTTADVVDCIHLVDATPELDFCMSMGIPAELGATNAYRQQYALMATHTTKPHVVVCDDKADCVAIVAMASAAAGGIAQLRLNPTFALYSEPSTPLRHSQTATGKLLYMAEQQLPVIHSPAPMMGGTAPATLAGGLAIGNAEVLSGLVMHQLKHRGAPFIFGSGLHHMDMRTMISVYGAPEFQLARVGVMEMGRHYGLPTWGYAGHSDSCAMDEQAATDATFSVLVAFLSGTNLAHDIGYLEAGMTTSPEMIVLCAENISMMRRFMDGISFDAESLALEAIDLVGPGGDFLASDNTLSHFREFWQPTLFDRRRLADWVADGSKRMSDRLRDKTVAIIEGHRPDPLPDNVRSEIAYILEDGNK